MNKVKADILNELVTESYSNQRNLAKTTGYSLGIVNRMVRELIQEGYLTEQIAPTQKTLESLEENTPKNAIILAAGYGMRMAPINTETSKGLIEVDGEPLIERIIKQLHEVEINEIYVVVGFLKEQYEYLIDEYGVKLICNPEYAHKNNIHSMKYVLKYLSNSYVIPCDVWCKVNPFRKYELYSWYMVGDFWDKESSVRVNRKMELVSVLNAEGGNAMIGISYLMKQEALIVRNRITDLCMDSRHDGDFWEEALYQKDKMILMARVESASDMIEINTYEQLQELGEETNHLKRDAMELIMQILQVEECEIKNIRILKKGMSNRSFAFECGAKKYVIRVPGGETEKFISREEEKRVYEAIKQNNISENVIYIDVKNGYKISEYIENTRYCNPSNQKDVAKCMEYLREFHEMGFEVGHEFNLFEKLEHYEQLRDGKASVYKDYQKTKENVCSLKPYIDAHAKAKVLTHIDAVPDNFLFVQGQDEEELKLIDWEYAAMQDPHIDIAMFAVYAMYEKKEIDMLIDMYFRGNCEKMIRLKIYCYIAVCGLMWSNWCEYKRYQGGEFGEYSLRQYRYAKEYYRIVKEELQRMEDKHGL